MRKKVITAADKANVRIAADMRVSLDIELKDSENRKTISLNSSVEEILDDGGLIIHAPTHKGHYYSLPNEDSFLLHFFVHTVMYATPVKYVDRFKRDNLAYVKLRRLGGIERRQRRHCFRLPCDLPVTVERGRKAKHNKPLECQMVNFSDGGMLFTAAEDFEIGEKIHLTFEIGVVETIAGEVLRVESFTDGVRKYLVAVQFHSRERGQKDRFYKYIAKTQHERLRRE